MRTHDLDRSLASLFSELVHGVRTGAFVLNSGDAGLVAALDRLSAADASVSTEGGATVAAHVRHVQYGLSLMNRWAAGENPFESADWAAAWETGTVSETEWKQLREGLREEADRWHAALKSPREISGAELDGVIGSIVHLAYHFGAMRQIQPALRGPKEPAGDVAAR